MFNNFKTVPRILLLFAVFISSVAAETEFFEGDFYRPDGSPLYGFVPVPIVVVEGGPPLINRDQQLPGMLLEHVENGINGSSMRVTHQLALKPGAAGSDTLTRLTGLIFSAPAGENEFCGFNHELDGLATSVRFSIDLDVYDVQSVDSVAIQGIGWTSQNSVFNEHVQIPIQSSGLQTIEWQDSSPRLIDYLNNGTWGETGLGFAFFTQADISGGPVEFSAIVDNFSASIQTVPEPSSALIVLLSAMGIAVFYRRGLRAV